MPCDSPSATSSATGAGLPNRWTGRNAFVFEVIAGSAVSAVISQVSGSMSQKTGVAPTLTTASGVAKNVTEGTTTSSPGPTPSARSPIWSASVPLATPTQCGRPEEVGELGLEGLDLGAEDVLAALEHGALAVGDLGEEGLERRLVGEEGDGHQGGAG